MVDDTDCYGKTIIPLWTNPNCLIFRLLFSYQFQVKCFCEIVHNGLPMIQILLQTWQKIAKLLNRLKFPGVRYGRTIIDYQRHTR